MLLAYIVKLIPIGIVVIALIIVGIIVLTLWRCGRRKAPARRGIGAIVLPVAGALSIAAGAMLFLL